jgi:RNA polymerase sigma factor (sigma-70 family)
MGDSTTTGTLVRHAAMGDEVAWADIVRSYTPLLASVCRRFGLSGMDADDIGARVWLHLLANISRIRDPAALPGWLRTTARRECQAVLRKKRVETLFVDERTAGLAAPSDTRLLDEEQWFALRAAIDSLGESDQALLSLLFSDPPTPYAEISARLDIPVGAIGPTRQRIMTRLRRAHVWRNYSPTL